MAQNQFKQFSNTMGGQMGGTGMSGMGGNRGGSSNKSEKSDEEDPCIPKYDRRYCYTLDPITGIVHTAVPDTTFEGIAQRESMESRALAIAYTGNLGSPHQVESYFDRRKPHDFIFLNAYGTMVEDPSQMLYYNTRMPFTVIRYSNSGGSLFENDHLVLDFAGNVNKRIGLGTKLDYTYARGTYLSNSTKPLKWKSYLYYEGEQYKAYLSYQRAKLANQENGGIVNRNVVLHPDDYDRTATSPNTMQTNLNEVWNDNMLNQVHFQHGYTLGYWEEIDNPGDTVTTEKLVPVGTIFHSIDFESWNHTYRMDDPSDSVYFTHSYINNKLTNDSTSYRNFSTYAGIRLNEGFSRFSQFAISGFVGFELQKYTMMQDTLDKATGFINRSHSSANLWAGGQLSRHLSSALTFDATAKVGISGDKAGDVEVNGTAQSVIPLSRTNNEGITREDSLVFQVSGEFNNRHTSYMMQKYFSNHFKWNFDDDTFKPEQHTRIEGRIRYALTGTSLRGGYENINNYHYFSPENFLPTEASDAINIFAVELRQNLHIGKWFNWENAVLYQRSSNEDIIPLPKLSIESDMSLRFTIAKTLHVHLGAVGYYHTKYFAPNYQPALQQFVSQNEYECGGFPVVNAYMNCNLKRIKFFIEMQNVLDKMVTNDTFLMPYYPIEPRRFCFGMILDLQN